MGTSSIYNGRNRSPLLPSDFNDDGDGSPNSPNPQDKPEQKPDESNPSGNPREDGASPQVPPSNNPQHTPWRQAKNSMSKYASGNSGRNGKKNAVSNYVKGYGGARNAAKSAKSAIRTTINIGNFFGGVSKKGIEQILKEYQIPIEGRKPKEILSDIVNCLAPTPNLNDDSVASVMSLIH
jgi:hypothetical protein